MNRGPRQTFEGGLWYLASRMMNHIPWMLDQIDFREVEVHVRALNLPFANHP